MNCHGDRWPQDVFRFYFYMISNGWFAIKELNSRKVIATFWTLQDNQLAASKKLVPMLARFTRSFSRPVLLQNQSGAQFPRNFSSFEVYQSWTVMRKGKWWQTTNDVLMFLAHWSSPLKRLISARSWVGIVGSGMGSNKEHLRLSSLKSEILQPFERIVFFQIKPLKPPNVLTKSKHSSLYRAVVRTPHESVCCRSLQGLTTRIMKHKILSTTMSLSKHQQGRLCLSTLQQIHADEPKPKNTPLALRIHSPLFSRYRGTTKIRNDLHGKLKAGPCHWSWMFLVQACWESTDIVGACLQLEGSVGSKGDTKQMGAWKCWYPQMTQIDDFDSANFDSWHC